MDSTANEAADLLEVEDISDSVRWVKPRDPLAAVLGQAARGPWHSPPGPETQCHSVLSTAQEGARERHPLRGHTFSQGGAKTVKCGASFRAPCR